MGEEQSGHNPFRFRSELGIRSSAVKYVSENPYVPQYRTGYVSKRLSINVVNVTAVLELFCYYYPYYYHCCCLKISSPARARFERWDRWYVSGYEFSGARTTLILLQLHRPSVGPRAFTLGRRPLPATAGDDNARVL